jgi:hypothetical protein
VTGVHENTTTTSGAFGVYRRGLPSFFTTVRAALGAESMHKPLWTIVHSTPRRAGTTLTKGSAR